MHIWSVIANGRGLALPSFGYAGLCLGDILVFTLLDKAERVWHNKCRMVLSVT